MPRKKPSVSVITMGCSKNLVDSERLMRRIEAKGYAVSHNPEVPDADYVVVNTCGFIGDAKEESVNMILQLVALREEGRVGSLIVMGCLSERYLAELRDEIPEVDAWYGKFDWGGIIDLLPDRSADAGKRPHHDWERSLTTKPWTAYVKVSEGCNRFCAFCAIPHITGRHTSRPLEEIVAEVRALAASGVKEFNIIAQDLSSYGLDLYGSQRLPELVEALAGIEGVEWIRLHYLYPSDFPMGLLDVMNRHGNVCKYLDIALQHVSTPVLRAMNRKITREETLSLLHTIRERVPGICLRTTVMTGFPGEGEEEFAELLDFVESQRFERLGGFAYCEEENTLAADTLEDSVSQEVKERRLERVMDLQRDISRAHNEALVGRTLRVLVEELDPEGFAVGRTEFDSPEVDQEVIIHGCQAEPGSFVTVTVTVADDYSLTATLSPEQIE